MAYHVCCVANTIENGNFNISIEVGNNLIDNCWLMQHTYTFRVHYEIHLKSELCTHAYTHAKQTYIQYSL